MVVQNAELVACETPRCFGTLIHMGGSADITARAVAKSCGWQVVDDKAPRLPWVAQVGDVCPACVAGRGPITKTACPSCGGCGGNLICTYCGAEQPRDVED